jgi:uncharacterized membrane protein
MRHAASEMERHGHRWKEENMAEFYTIYAYAGSYTGMGTAKEDFEAVSKAHHAKTIGKFQAAIFTKEADGKIKIVNTTSTTRTSGAKWGAAVGAVAGVLFPPSILVGLVVGTTMGAVSGNLVKGWGAAELKTFGAALEAGDVGVIALAEGLKSEGAPELLPNATSREVQEFDKVSDQLRAALDEG